MARTPGAEARAGRVPGPSLIPPLTARGLAVAAPGLHADDPAPAEPAPSAKLPVCPRCGHRALRRTAFEPPIRGSPS